MSESRSNYRNAVVGREAARKTAPTNQTADRAFEVLGALLVARRPLAVSEIARTCGFAPSTTHRLLASLVRYNFAQQDPETSKYRLGLGLLEYGYAILNGLDVREHAAAVLTELNRATRETIHLAILDGHDLVYIDRRDTQHGIRVNTSIGRRGTPHTTGIGKALLAFLPEPGIDTYLDSVRLEPKTTRSITDPDVLRRELAQTRERGYAVDDGEDKDHVCCVAAPILGAGGHPVASISISVPDSRATVDDLLRLTPLLLEQTQRLSRSIGFRS